MSIEGNGEIHLHHLVTEVLNPWYKYGWLEFSRIDNNNTSISILYDHLASIFQKHDLGITKGNTVTLEGSMAEVASGLADPNLLSRLRHDLLKSNYESINIDPVLKDFLPVVHTTDSDIIIHLKKDQEPQSIIQKLTNSRGDFTNITNLPEGYRVEYVALPIRKDCTVITLTLYCNNIPIHHVDISEKPVGSDLVRDRRTGKSRQELIQHPLTVKDGKLFVEKNRRISSLQNHDLAVNIDKKELPSLVVMALRDARKAFTAIASTNTSITPLSKLNYPDHFLKYKTRKRIRDYARQYKYHDLEDDDFIKISIQKEIMLMATLDPYLTLWWLHATGLDKYIWGNKYEIQKSMVKDIEEKRNGYRQIIESTYDQDTLTGWMIVQQIMTSSVPQPPIE